MSANSKIEWTDHTFNPWWGCTHVHEGCRHCYAEIFANRFGVKWGPSGVRRLSSDSVWKQPLKWNRAAQKSGVRAKVFCASMADVFEDWDGPIVNHDGKQLWKAWNGDTTIPSVTRPKPKFSPLTMGDVRDRLFGLIDETPHLDWQLLTKRPENIRRMWPAIVESGSLIAFNDQDAKAIGVERGVISPAIIRRGNATRSNVCLGTSISDQASADKQIHELQECRDLSPVLFLSIEPLLGPIDLDLACAKRDLSCIDWVIVGGESGNGARPTHPDWVRSLRDQCIAAEVPFFFKQWGEWCPRGPLEHGYPSVDGVSQVRMTDTGQDGSDLSATGGNHVWMNRVGKHVAGRLLDGREWSEFPIVESEAV